jgi:hypothetical protein
VIIRQTTAATQPAITKIVKSAIRLFFVSLRIPIKA